MSRVEELVRTLQATLEELVEIEKESNQRWREYNEELSVLDHELEIVPLNGPQLIKVASYRKKARIDRRAHKNAWFESKAFNDSFQTGRILHSMATARRNLSRQQRQAENLIEDRGLIASILTADKVIAPATPLPVVSLEESAKKMSTLFDESEESVDLTN